MRYKPLKNKGFHMDIFHLRFEEPITLTINGQLVEVTAFKTAEDGNIKFGVKAPRALPVHREEVFHAIKKKQLVDNN